MFPAFPKKQTTNKAKGTRRQLLMRLLMRWCHFKILTFIYYLKKSLDTASSIQSKTCLPTRAEQELFHHLKVALISPLHFYGHGSVICSILSCSEALFSDLRSSSFLRFFLLIRCYLFVSPLKAPTTKVLYFFNFERASSERLRKI